MALHKVALGIQKQQGRQPDQTKLADIGHRGLPVGVVINPLQQAPAAAR